MRSRTAEWFLCRIKYDKTMEDGLQKKVTEQFVVDALSFTEAEARIMEQMASYISGEYDIQEIDRAPYKEVFFMQYAEKVLDNHSEELEAALRKKDKKAFKKWDDKKLDDVLEMTDSKWYKAKLQFITIDERTAKEKKSNVYYLVNGTSLESARKNIDDVMSGTMIDYTIAALSETPIVDVFEYQSNK